MTDEELIVLDDFVGSGAAFEVSQGADINEPNVQFTASKLRAERINADRRLARPRTDGDEFVELSLHLPEIDMLAGLLHKGLLFDAAKRRVPLSELYAGSFSRPGLGVQRGLHVAQSFHWLTPEVAADNFALYNRSPGHILLFIGPDAEEFSFPIHSWRFHTQSPEQWVETQWSQS
ncbi:MAG: hypothetical protein ABWX94_00020 [Candidatus Saccharimonadales bacterium]